MSELAKMLTATSTRRRVVDYPPVSAVVRVSDSLTPAPFESSYVEALEYRVVATLGSSVIARNEKQLQTLIPSVKRRIIEYIFGEFRLPLMEIHQCIHERDLDGADKLISKILEQMFEEGL